MAMAEVIVEAGFAVGAAANTYLVIGDSARGIIGTATIGPSTAVWEDITDHVRSWSYRRGSNTVESPLVRYDAGTATIVLRNEDRRFDPTNLDGPYVASGATQLVPMRPVRIRATHGGVTYNLWQGYADGWKVTYPNLNYSKTILRCTDAFKVFRANDRAASGSAGAGDDSGARITRILNGIGWAAADRVIATGNTTLQATTLAGAVLTEMQLVADTEIGELYMDAAGRVVFRNRHALMTDTRSNTAQAVFDDDGTDLPYSDVELDADEEQLINQARITRAGGAEQSASDSQSITDYLTHTYGRSDLLMQTDAVALAYGQWLVNMAKDPEQRFETLQVNPRRDEDNLFPAVLSLELGDRVTVNRNPPGGGTVNSQDCFIRGIAQSGTPATWSTEYTLQAATRYSFFTIGHSQLGVIGANAIGY